MRRVIYDRHFYEMLYNLSKLTYKMLIKFVPLQKAFSLLLYQFEAVSTKTEYSLDNTGTN